ncbi:9732_t:CDS:2 [Funneliformis geosporum]|uniref:8117_t:CDS:1 n=1 Tax=Funneliformis geosporum TaxID=1117311 RepID=A0A9W4SLH3_9GLOM|nr:9732_t:CDS:2 [Funneliformis geosporum]CAI2171324.1 8117_t:CDS:2 [Funneliformis geosporum]
MKNLSTTLFIILIGLCLTHTVSSEKCIQYSNPLNQRENRVFDCLMASPSQKRQLPTPPTSDNMFNVQFNCLVDDKVLCGKVENVFVTAGKFITATLNLKSEISVNATFLNFCEVSIAPGIDCNNPYKVILGAAGPAMVIPYKDVSADKVRLYPQALYKQMGLPTHPQFATNEIMAVFNSAANYWFEGDPLPMLERQADMLLVVTHELVHGLGFTTAWDDQFAIGALTPVVATLTDDDSPKAPGPIPKEPGIPVDSFQFFELIFDSFLILTEDGTQMTTQTDELNKFQINLQEIKSEAQLIEAFKASPQFKVAQNLFIKATTNGSMGFKTTSGDVVTLETDLHPFQPSSSIGHVDFATYKSSADFLMVFRSPSATLGQMMGMANSIDTYGPIGPLLREVLQSIGYEIKGQYVPPVDLPSSKIPIPNKEPFSIQPDDANENGKNNNKMTNNGKINSSSNIINVLIALAYILFNFFL